MKKEIIIFVKAGLATFGRRYHHATSLDLVILEILLNRVLEEPTNNVHNENEISIMMINKKLL